MRKREVYNLPGGLLLHEPNLETLNFRLIRVWSQQRDKKILDFISPEISLLNDILLIAWSYYIIRCNFIT